MKKLVRFFVNVKKELKKVRWPKKKEMIKFSVATIGVLCFFMLFFTVRVRRGDPLCIMLF